MTARDDILAGVRAALSGAEPSSREVPRGYRTPPPTPREQVLDLFASRVEDYRATVHRCGEEDVGRVLAETVGERSVIVPAGMPWPLGGETLDIGQSAADLDRIEAVVTTATVAIATTGTIVLDHGPGQGRRALTLVPDLHVCVVQSGQVVLSVPEAVARLDPTRPTTWVSGPSATSDIELSRVEGVHGPRTLHVVLVDVT